MATEYITIVVEEKGTRTVQRRLSNVGKKAAGSAQGVNLLRNALLAIGGTAVVTRIIRVADAFTNLQNRLRLVTEDTANLNEVTKELLAISNATRSSFESNAELFSRVSRSVQDLGVSQRDVLQFTESLNQAIIMSGVSAQEANAGLIQLSQGLASGTLRGDELRSVMEQLPAVARVIARDLGITIGELRKMGTEGKITGEIILTAFKNARVEIAGEFAKTVPTVSQSFQILKNNVVNYIGTIDQASGITGALGSIIRGLSTDIDTLARVLGAGGLTAALFLATNGVRLFTAAIAANPLGAMLVALTFLISLLVTFSDKLLVSSDSLTTLQDLGVATFERIRFAAGLLVDYFETAFSGLDETFGGALGEMDISFEGFLRAVGRGLDWWVGGWRGAINALTALWNGLGMAWIDLGTQAINGLIGVIESGIDGIMALFQILGRSISNIAIGIYQSLSNLATAARLSIQGETEAAAQIAGNAVSIAEARFKTAFADLPGQIGRQFEKNAETDFIPRVENIAEGAALELSNAVVDGFLDGFDQIDVFEKSINDLFDRADEISKKRIAEQATGGAAGADLSSVAAGGGGAPTPQEGPSRQFQEIIANLQQQQQLLRMTNSEREIQNQLLKIETQLKKEKIDLSDAERAQLETELQRVQVTEQVASALDEVRGVQFDLIAIQMELNEQVAAGNITVDEATQAYRNLQTQSLETSKTVQAGFQRGFNQISNTINDFASQSEKVITNAYSNAEDALVNFVQTGELSFSSLVDSMLADLTRLLARQAMMAILGAIVPGGSLLMAGAQMAGGMGGGGGAGGMAATGVGSSLMARAGGGPVAPSNSYLVGEKGPELFTPSQQGNITPARETAQGMAATQEPPQVNVQVVNVTDPSEVTSALGTKDGEEAILNVIRRNKRSIQGLL
ncbi:MAG: phage tail tape measure protein [Candidatus Sabulitectum sp.]|nr:phage tail tape measure protein [Candidatus Sabulitectum sp.]